jgi:hypothetical protein
MITLIVLGVIAGLVVVGGIVGIVIDKARPHKHLTAVDHAAGLDRVTDPEALAQAQRLRDSLPKEFHNSVVAFYRRPGSTDSPDVAIVGGDRRRGYGADRDLDAFLRGVRIGAVGNGAQLGPPTSVPAGPRGGTMRCQPVTSRGGVTGALCAWADADTLGGVVGPRIDVTSLAAISSRMRVDIEN